MTNTFTPTRVSHGHGLQPKFLLSQVRSPLFTTASPRPGDSGVSPTITEADLLLSGIGQSTAGATNFPIYATNYGGIAPTNNYQYVPYGLTSTTCTWEPPSANWASYTNAGVGGSYTNCAPGYTRVQPAFFGNLFTPTVGYASMLEDYWIEVDGLNSFTWTDGKGNTYPMFTQASTETSLYGNFSQLGGYMGIFDFADSYGYYGPSGGNNVDAYKVSGGAPYLSRNRLPGNRRLSQLRYDVGTCPPGGRSPARAAPSRSNCGGLSSMGYTGAFAGGKLLCRHHAGARSCNRFPLRFPRSPVRFPAWRQRCRTPLTVMGQPMTFAISAQRVGHKRRRYQAGVDHQPGRGPQHGARFIQG